MTTVRPNEMRAFARALINDNYASTNDAEIITRLHKLGETSRAGIDAAIDEIEKAPLPLDKKKSALRALESYYADIATGLHKDLYSANHDVVDSLANAGITSLSDILSKCATFAQRESVGSSIGVSEKALRDIAKQADLQRVDGVDAKLARVLINIGVDSAPELKQRNVESLLDKLEAFSTTMEAYVMKFEIPTKGTGTLRERRLNALNALKTEAAALPKVLTFERAQNDWQSLSYEQRIEFMREERAPTVDYPTRHLNHIEDVAHRYGDGDMLRFLRENHKAAMENLRHELADAGVEVSLNTLLECQSWDDLTSRLSAADQDVLANGSADVFPTIIDHKDANGKLLGLQLKYDRNLDGDHNYTTDYFWDASEKQFIGSLESGYEVNDELSAGAWSEDRPAATRARAEGYASLVEGALYMSESDSGLIPLAFKDGPTKNRVAKALGQSVDDVISVSSPADFFARYTDPQENPYGAVEAAKFAALKNKMESELTDVKLYKVERTQAVFDYVLIGKDADGNAAGVTYFAVET